MGCFATNFLLQRQWEAGEGPPYLGMAEIDGARASAAVSATRQFLGGESARLGELFARFPFVAAWCVADPLRGLAADAGAALAYHRIGRVLAVDLARAPARQRLFDGFAAVCRLAGLPVDVTEPVDLYRFQAGLAEEALGPLVEAFNAQERHFGPPPAESTTLMKGWQDAALAFLPAGADAVRDVLAGDDTAYHAALYARLRVEIDDRARLHRFERAFADLMRRLGDDDARGSRPPLGPSALPIGWADGGPCLILPRGVDTLVWAEGGDEPLRACGPDWPLPEPWPRRIHWRAGAAEGTTDFLAGTDSVAVVDLATGRLLVDRCIAAGDLSVDATDVAVLARQPFRVDGEDASLRGDGAAVRVVRLTEGPVRIGLGRWSATLRATTRRRIALCGPVIAEGPLAALRSLDTVVRIETGLAHRQSRCLRLEFGSAVGTAMVRTDGAGNAESTVGALLGLAFGTLPDDPEALRIELLPPEGNARGVSINTFVWPAFRASGGGLIDSAAKPSNLVAELSSGIETGEGGSLRLLDNDGGRPPQAVFEIAGAYVPFRFARADTLVMRRRGAAAPWRVLPGAHITAAEDGVADSLVVRSCDPAASLSILGRHEPDAFAAGPVRTVAVRRPAADLADNRVVLHRADGSEVVLFDITPALDPATFAVRHGPRVVDISVDVGAPPDAVSARLEDEQGQCFSAATSVRSSRPIHPPAGWLSARSCPEDRNRLVISVDRLAPGAGLRLLRLHIRTRRPDCWQALATPGGAHYGLVLPQARMSSAEPERRLRQLGEWLDDPFADPCRPEIEATLLARWRLLGAAVADRAAASGVRRRTVAVSFTGGPPTSWTPATRQAHLGDHPHLDRHVPTEGAQHLPA